jgi:MFS superfamily sulfate permease-like transporter
VIAGFLMIVLVSVLLPILKYLPMACVAAILMNVAYRMLEMDELKHIFVQDKGQFLITVVVAVVSIVDEPTTGIVFGWIVTMLRTCVSLSKGNTKVFVRQGSSVITTFYSDIVLTDKVMPPFIFRRRVKLDTPDAVQECFVFNPEHAPRSKPHSNGTQHSADSRLDWGSSPQNESELATLEPGDTESTRETTWEDVRGLGVSEEDSRYSLVVHYLMQGQLSFITCTTHLKRIININCDIVLIDLADVAGVDLDGQVRVTR